MLLLQTMTTFCLPQGRPTFNIKIGLPAQRITTGEFVFKLSESLACGDPNWNTSLRSNYFAMEGVTGFEPKGTFDAIVLHPTMTMQGIGASRLLTL